VTGWWAGENASNKKAKENKKTSQQKAFERGRMLWFLAAGVGMIGYLLASGIVQIQFGSTDDLEEEEVDEDEEEEDGDEDEDEEDLSPLTGLVDNDDE
jgi:sorting and assembly machinery component 37